MQKKREGKRERPYWVLFGSNFATLENTKIQIKRKFSLPVSLIIVGEQFRNDAFDSDEPRGNCLVEQGSVRTPAERVRVLHLKTINAM